VTYAALGESEWTARLWPALTGFAGILVVALASIRLWSLRIGILAGMLLGTSAGYFLAGQFLTLDMGLTFFLTCALMAFLIAQQEGMTTRQRTHWMLASWAALGLGVLSKGLVAFALPALALFIYAISTRSVAVLTRVRLVSGGILVLLIATPWFVLVQQQNPEFFHFFFVKEHFERFSMEGHHRLGPWWYFIPIGLLGMMPWTSPAMASLVGLRSLFRRPSKRTFDRERFLLIWVLTIFVFFSLSKSKLPAYVLPAFPALAILAAIQLTRFPKQHLKHSARTSAIIGAIWVAALPFLDNFRSAEPVLRQAASAVGWLYAAGIVMFVTGLLSLRLQGRGQLWPAANLLAGSMLVSCLLISVFFSAVDGHYSARRLIEQMGSDRRPFDGSIPFYSVEMFDHSLPFYLQRTLTLVNYKSELGEGIAAEPQKYVDSMDAFVSTWAGLPAGFAVVTPKRYSELKILGLPMRELARDERRVLVARR
jgi:4-amino-4-deoxy-L-arabinose transferase-like glycosyltransferase